MALWEEIQKQRENNRDNPDYPHVYWSNDVQKKLHVRIGDFESDDMSLSDAIELFGQNEMFMLELKYLLEAVEVDRDNDRLSSINSFPTPPHNMESILLEIDEKIDEIIRELHLEQSDDFFVQLKNCCLVQKYIVEHIEYHDSIMEEKEGMNAADIRILDLYNAAVGHVGVCSSNSILFQEILRRVGIKVECVALKSTEGGFHMANLVELDGQYYYFDSTLERSIYEDYAKEGMDLMLCCAALGSGEYEQFYHPEAILPDNPLAPVRPVPTNISLERIPQPIVNDMIHSSGDAKS